MPFGEENENKVDSKNIEARMVNRKSFISITVNSVTRMLNVFYSKPNEG